MKIIRFTDESGKTVYGVPAGDGTANLLVGDLLGKHEASADSVKVVRVLAPIVPSAIIGIGLNYREHARETNAKIPEWPIVFYKNPGSVIGPDDPIELPRKLRSDKVDYECELAVVIGKSCKNVSRDKALDYVLGYTCANDVSARDWQKEWGGGQWSRAKSFDTFCPLGPVLVTADEISNPNSLPIRTLLNGEAVQDWNTSDMIFDVATLIEFLSGSMTLSPLTVILTGTPSGVGVARTPPLFLKPADEVTIEVDGIGSLTNPVIEESVV